MQSRKERDHVRDTWRRGGVWDHCDFRRCQKRLGNRLQAMSAADDSLNNFGETQCDATCCLFLMAKEMALLKGSYG